VRWHHPVTSESLPDWKLGLLVKYETWEKVGTILYDGKLVRIRSSYIQKAGKKDEGR